jgi:D-lactate dehydrogenase (cytochrome)
MSKREVGCGVEGIEEVCRKFGGVGIERGEDELWHLRKSAFFSVKKLRSRKSEVLTTDCAVPVSRLSDILEQSRRELTRLNLTASIVAHAGDGNLHCLVLVDPSDQDEVDRAEEFRRVNAEYAISLQGTCTGEHGIGVGKRELLVTELGEETVDIMRRIKKVLDPNGIMNPGKIFFMERKGVTAKL